MKHWLVCAGMKAELGLNDASDDESESFSQPRVVLSAYGDSPSVKTTKQEEPKPALQPAQHAGAKAQVCMDELLMLVAVSSARDFVCYED